VGGRAAVEVDDRQRLVDLDLAEQRVVAPRRVAAHRHEVLAQRPLAVRAVVAIEHQEDRHAPRATGDRIGGEIHGGRQRVQARAPRCARRRVDARADLRARRQPGNGEHEC
jgi:hypothetical protein